jgi:transcriptional regulator with XRE-family HTH domain
LDVAKRDKSRQIYQHVVARLIERRLLLGLTQSELAAEAGFDQSQISKFERGERMLDIVDYVRLCSALDVDPGIYLREFPPSD